ncbi:enoyl-CoA hydratase/isomerase family protein [Marininema halotolerans]|uniref:Enoyl-CoA hydratase/carnithine racemase n=1 Tax=Marininema halotolerans TaxID=1155944 RepID=A0A1I6QBP8_9BACL|nr:enoyl-CoA hydratase/isomerase family protein [Marininema halotolerans]SFS49720.1 Enoyl-CoA hydratase/carnithine racemase [Marininema halotolerans]
MKTLQVWKQNEVGWVQFYRPHVRNAVNQRMMDELESHLDIVKADNEVKVLVFTGDEQTFVSGGDLEEFHRLTKEEEVFPVMHRMGQLLERVRNIGKPTIAAIGGVAVGGGCEIAASCDFRLAAEGTTLGFIQSTLGITPGWGGGTRLLEELPRSQALFLLLSGKRVKASQLYEWGWLHALYPQDEFIKGVQDFAESVAQAPLPTIQALISLANDSRNGVSRDQLIRDEARHCAKLWESDEHHQAVEAFLTRTRGRKNS